MVAIGSRPRAHRVSRLLALDSEDKAHEEIVQEHVSAAWYGGVLGLFRPTLNKSRVSYSGWFSGFVTLPLASPQASAITLTGPLTSTCAVAIYDVSRAASAVHLHDTKTDLETLHRRNVQRCQPLVKLRA